MERLKRYLDLLSPEEAQKALTEFWVYYKELIEWNAKFNLTAITEKEDVIVKHFADSLEGAKYFSGKVCDVGSGAGFPSIPVAIINPKLEFVLLDSVNKKVGFLNHISQVLSVKAKALHIRAEDASLKYREYFDTVTARAVAPMRTLAEYMLPLLKVGGRAVVYKGSEADEEINESRTAIAILGGDIEKIIKYNLLDTDNKRSLIIIKKVRHTPKEYPRTGNKPRIDPL